MSDYIHLFETQAAHDAVYNGSQYTEPWVGLVTANDSVSYNNPEYKLRSVPLTFEIISDGNIMWKHSLNTYTIEYKKNNGDWTSITSTTSGATIPVVSGDVVQLRGNAQTYGATSGYTSFTGTTAGFNVSGNIMSLSDKTDFETCTTLIRGSERYSQYKFYHLFDNCTGLIDASKLLLPATTLTASCYGYMFKGCTNLTAAPKLPATILTNKCYISMFEGCTSLTTAPELPATTLAENCYYRMFYGCTSLTTAPELPATTLANYCYGYMFRGCTNLITVPTILPATTLANNCYEDMFQGCTSLTTAPELPATTLVDRCYDSMFNNCSNLNYIKCLAMDISASNCLSYWVIGVQTTSGTFVKNPNMLSWTTGTSGIPSGWTVQDAS